ncbi:hypothetical protein [Oceanimonas baumannii]|uniref:DUF4760 domain-containing protein n=2 Tax=Oceanimonas baumannii TaxID=129578 RepID=A0A235CLW9_9GAMM|nr:hypothetical protein [Oceanimonas baumannii]OYD25563.1 hypothetical protein B6S09_04955 [Oceanimonas baumannii]
MPDWIISLLSAAFGAALGYSLSWRLEQRRVSKAKDYLYLDVSDLTHNVKDLLLSYSSIYRCTEVKNIRLKMDFHDWAFNSLVQYCAGYMEPEERRMMKRIPTLVKALHERLDVIGELFINNPPDVYFAAKHHQKIIFIIHACAELYYILYVLNVHKEKFCFPSEYDEKLFVRKGLEWSNLPLEKIQDIMR